MKVKLDENVTAHLVELLAAAGHQVDTVGDEGLVGATDADVWAACQSEGRLLLTFDVGFGDVRAYRPGSHAGVVLLRLQDQRPAAVVDVVRRFLIDHELDNVAGSLVVVSEDRVRIRT